MFAHLVQTGFGGFYDGLVHLFVTLEDVLLATGLVLLAVLGGKRAARMVALAAAPAWFAGGVAGLLAPGAVPDELALTISFGTVGLLVALDRRLPLAGLVALSAGCALLHGMSTGGAMREAGYGVLGVAGSSVGLLVAISLAAALLAGFEQAAARIVMRVGGSWIAAAAMLMAGWIIRAR